jgi:MoxR-like ATPase
MIVVFKGCYNNPPASFRYKSPKTIWRLKMDFDLCKRIVENISRVIVGKLDSIELLLAGLLADGHVLLEDIPGLGKTLIAKSLARSIGASFKRVQFTPDLLPADITGFNVYNQRSGQFVFQPGPVMTHVLLADEINRTIPRTQSSLLESMEERQVTVDGTTYPLPNPFFVMATQNPIELEGTFPLPEAQLDRFLLRVHLGYPDNREEINILDRFQEDDPLLGLSSVAAPEEISALQDARKKILVSHPVKEYIVSIVNATRESSALRLGASPRGSLGLMRAGQALAALRGRNYVLPDDIKYLVIPVLAHRLILKEEERLRGSTREYLLEEIMGRIPVPAKVQQA